MDRPAAIIRSDSPLSAVVVTCDGVCLINDNVKNTLDLLLLCRTAPQLTVPMDRRIDIRCTGLFFKFQISSSNRRN